MVKNISGITSPADFPQLPKIPQKEIKESQTSLESPINSLEEALKILQKLPESLANLMKAEQQH